MRIGSRGRCSYVIYAVVVRDQPDFVKIGRTANWNQRRKHYASWNLARNKDAIVSARIFVILDEYVSLVDLEKACLEAMPSYPSVGAEWFEESIETAEKTIDRVISNAGLFYDMLVE
jgi:hypothetical protein